MSVGLPTTKNEIDTRAGDLARSILRNFAQIAMLKSYLDATLDADLVAMGYTAGEVATLKSGTADLAQLATIWSGGATLPAAKDFRTFVRPLWGVGAF